MVFNALISNIDDHPRNHGAKRPAPANLGLLALKPNRQFASHVEIPDRRWKRPSWHRLSAGKA
jgi:hypothetical protein